MSKIPAPTDYLSALLSEVFGAAPFTSHVSPTTPAIPRFASGGLVNARSCTSGPFTNTCTPGAYIITTLALPSKDDPSPKPMSTNYDLPSLEAAQGKALDIMRQRPNLASAFVCEIKGVIARDGLLGMDHAEYSRRMDKRQASAAVS